MIKIAPIVTTAGGRELSGGGGVFPDQRISNDTLTLNERAFRGEILVKKTKFSAPVAG